MRRPRRPPRRLTKISIKILFNHKTKRKACLVSPVSRRKDTIQERVLKITRRETKKKKRKRKGRVIHH